jgi:hypothetical protein
MKRMRRDLTIVIVVVALLALAAYCVYAQQTFQRSFGGDNLTGQMRVSATLLDKDGNPVDEASVKQLAWVTASGREVTKIQWKVILSLSYRDMRSPLTITAKLTYPTDDVGGKNETLKVYTVEIATYDGTINRVLEFEPVDLPTLTTHPGQVPTVYRLQYVIDVKVEGTTRFGEAISASDTLRFTAELIWQRAHLEVKIVPVESEPLALLGR